jgi:colicin import membrane protein
MRNPRIQSAFTFSLFFHALIFIAAFITIRHTHLSSKPTPYVVSIVEDKAMPNSPADVKTEITEPQKKETPKTKEPDIVRPKQKDTHKDDEKRVSERIAALSAKKRIEKIANIRNMIEVSGRKSEAQSKSHAVAQKTGKPGGSASSDYTSMVMSAVTQRWIYPEAIDKDLEAVVLIKVARDGKITIEKFQKKSDNALFDRTVLRALNSASPLPPPPQEMEIEMRFRP